MDTEVHEYLCEQMEEQQLDQTGAAVGTAGTGAAGAGGLDEIELSMADKIRRLVSTDEEWEAVLLQKMEEKRNRGKFARLH